MSQAKGELSKSNCPSIALKSANPLINSSFKVINWELYLSDNACVTARVFNRGKWTKFWALCCWATGLSFDWKAFTSRYNSWANTPLPCSFVLSSFSYCIMSTANAKSQTHSSLSITFEKSQEMSFILKNMTISALRCHTLFSTFPMPQRTFVWYSTSVKSASMSSRKLGNCLCFSPQALIEFTARTPGSITCLSVWVLKKTYRGFLDVWCSEKTTHCAVENLLLFYHSSTSQGQNPGHSPNSTLQT